MNRTADAELAGRLKALRRVAPFDRLGTQEIGRLVEMTVLKRHAPGVRVHAGEAPLPRLMVVVAGVLRAADGGAAGPVCGLASMFTEAPVGPLFADPAVGAEVIEINKYTFFTLAHECPEVVRGFLELGPQGEALAETGSPGPAE